MGSPIKNKNILIFLNSFWNNGKGTSGGDQMFVQIFKRIRKSFNKVYIFTSRAGKSIYEKELKDIGYVVSNVLFDKCFLIINYCLRTLSALSCLFIKDIDIVYSGSDFFPDVIPAFFYKLFHGETKWYQCVFHIYPSWHKRPGNKVTNFIAQYLQQFSLLFIHKADCVININTQVKKYLVDKGFDPNKIVVNTPGIDFSSISKLKVNNHEGRYDAVFLSRLMPSKGVFDLIRIWKKVVDIKPMNKLAIIGEGSNEVKKELIEEIAVNKLRNNIDVLGYLEDKEAFNLIKNSGVFLFPSHEEGFGIAIAEAMACGTPVIAWNLSVYDEVFEDNLVKVEENDINSFATKVVELQNSHFLSQNISNKAYNFIKKYQWREIASRHLGLLNI